uniref:Uncharacterized protein n=1 Tax=Cacopsylla melanoneura TaxID=428564 RepID=A0A8D8V8P9_9HEMI
MDPQLKWHAHIDYVAGKLNSRLFLLKQLRGQVSLTTLKNAYYGLFHSILSYGLLLWGHTPHSTKLFIIQKKAIRILARLSYNEHAKPSFINMGILTLPSMFVLQCLIHIKKNRERYVSFEQVHSYNTRHKGNIVLNSNRVNSSRNGPNYYSVNLFNKLPSRVRDMPFNQFKSLISNHLKRKAFYSIEEFLSCPCDPDAV